MAITPDKAAVLLGGLITLGLIRWYFFPARAAATAAAARGDGVQEIAITIDGG
jgi:plastocyanin domain-containing protein